MNGMTLTEYMIKKGERFGYFYTDLLAYIRTLKGFDAVTYDQDIEYIPKKDDGSLYEFDEWYKDTYEVPGGREMSDDMKDALRRTYFEPTTEKVDFENMEFERITDAEIVLVAGGDGQPPFRITVIMKSGEIEPEVASIVLLEEDWPDDGLNNEQIMAILAPNREYTEEEDDM